MRRERYEDALICLAFENLEIRRADAAARAAESAAPLEADTRARKRLMALYAEEE